MEDAPYIIGMKTLTYSVKIPRNKKAKGTPEQEMTDNEELT
jgi:hypothetical protein